MTEATLIIKMDSSEVGRAKKALDDLSDSSGRAEGSSQKLTSSSVSLASAAKIAAGALAAMGVFRGFGNVVDSTREFTKSISSLSAITGATGKDLEYYTEQAKQIGSTTTLSASQAAEAFKLIASAKPDLLSNAEALNAVTRSAVTLSEAAGTSLPEAAAALGNSLNQFGMDAKEADRVINVMAAGAKFGASSIADTTMALKNSGAAANAAGISFEETNAAIQALAAGGIKGAEAGTGLRNVLMILESETDQKTKPSIMGMAGAIENLAAKQLGLTELTGLFGRENAIAAQTLIVQSRNLTQLEKDITGTSIAFEQAATNVNNLDGDMKASASATEALQLALGARLEPALRKSTQGFTDIKLSMTDFVESDEFGEWFDDATDSVESFGAQGAATFKILTGTLRPWADDVKKAIIALDDVFNGFFENTGNSGIGIAGILSLAFGTTLTNIKSFVQVMTIESVNAFSKLKLEFGNIGATLAGDFDWMLTKIGLGGTALSESLRETYQATYSGPGGLTEQMRLLDQARLASIDGILAEHTASTNSLHEQVRLNGQARISLKELQEQRRSATDGAGLMRGAYVKMNGETEKSIELVDTLASITDVMTMRFDNATFSVLDFAKANNILTSGTEQITDKTLEYIDQLENEAKAINMSAKEQAMFNAELKALSNGDGPAAIQTVRDLAGANFDAAEEARLHGEAQEEAAEKAERQWERTHEYLSSAFVDIWENGDDAFQNIADSFSAMIKRMIAEWAASKLMNLFGIGGGGNTSTSTLSNIFGSLTGGGGGGGGGGGAGSWVSAATTGGKLLSAGSQFLGGMAGTAVGTGSAIVGPPTAAAAAGAGLGGSIMGGLAAIPGWGWAIGAAALAGALLNNDDGKKRENAGMLVGPTPGAKAEYLFGVDPFASGFQAQGFSRRGSREDAIAVISGFAEIDQGLTTAIQAAGGDINLSRATLAGLDEEATPGSSGTFLGVGGNGESTGDLAAQYESYAQQLVRHATGLDEEATAALRGATTLEQIASILALAGGRKVEAEQAAAGTTAAGTTAAGDLVVTGGDIGDAYGPENTGFVLSTREQNIKSAAESVMAAWNSGLSEQDSMQLAYNAFLRYQERGLTVEDLDKYTGAGTSEIQRVLDMMEPKTDAEKMIAFANEKLAQYGGVTQQGINEIISETEKYGMTFGGLAELMGVNVLDLIMQGFKVDGSHAIGLDYVPFDGYRAELHRGERVQTAAEARSGDNMSAELKETKVEMKKVRGEIQRLQLLTESMYRIFDKWDGGGLPAERA